MTQRGGADGPGGESQAHLTEHSDTKQPTGTGQPTDTGQPVGTGPSGTAPTGTGPADTAPADTEAVGTGPAGTGPAGPAPTGTGPAGAGPADAAAADTEGLDDGARAETYLRLLVESELRIALACPCSPVERIPQSAVLWAANAVGAVSGTAELAARSLRPAAERAGQAAGPWAASARRLLGPSARQAERALPPPIRRATEAITPQVRRAGQAMAPQARQAAAAVAPRVRRAGRAMAQAGWQARIAADWFGDRLTGPGQPDGPEPGDGLMRVHATADALVAAGVLSETVAESVTRGLGRALSARGLVDDHFPMHWHMAMDRNEPAPAGPILAAGVGARAELAKDGYRASMHLLALVQAPDETLLTTVSWLTESPPGRAEQEDDWAFDNGLGDLVQSIRAVATDNHGGTYRLEMDSGGGGSDGPWEARFSFSPSPPAGLDWLDLTMAPGQDPVRVDLTAAARDDQTGTPPPASPAERAEQIIDLVGERLLRHYDPVFEADDEDDDEDTGPDHEDDEDTDLADIAGIVRALRAVGALAPDSPALARLVTLARRQQRTVPPELASADAGGPVELPAAWQARLDWRPEAGWAGPAGPATAASAVAVLPELGGARCAIAGLLSQSETSTTTMQVLAWGWRWPDRWLHGPLRAFSWWARDDAGRWYRGEEGGYGSDGRLSEFQIELSPAVHPEATSLEIILIGLPGQVTATVPVSWARLP